MLGAVSGRTRTVRGCVAAFLAVCLAASACTSTSGTVVEPGTTSRVPPSQHSVEPAADQPERLAVRHHRRGPGVIAAGSAPTVIEGARSRMWWCGQGGDILHASASGMNHRFTTSRAVLSDGKRGTRRCDPSVVKADGVYHLYYTSATGDDGTAIGLATSKDGLRWRASGGRPIARGAGQPAVVHLGGWFYLMFTDTTASGGQTLLRSRDPEFQQGVQELGSLPGGSGGDLMWVDVLDAFAVAQQTRGGTTLAFWNRDFTEQPYPEVRVRGQGRDGPGLVRTHAGHAPISERDPCGTVPIDLVRATGKTSGLRQAGFDLVGASGCADRDDALRLLDGYAFPSPEHTMDLITDGQLIRIERRSVAVSLAPGGVLGARPTLPKLAVSARLNSGAPVLRSRDGGIGLLLDDRLWPLRTPSLAQRIARLNATDVRFVSDITWVAYPVASTLG